MTNRDPARGFTLAALLARSYADAPPHRIASTVALLQKVAKAHKASAVRACNVNLTEAQQEREDHRLAGLVSQVEAQFATLGDPCDSVSFEFGVGGPRGACGSLIVASESGDGWGDGFAIY